MRPSANHLMLAESWEFAPTSRIHPLAEHSQSGPGVCRDASALYMMQCLHAEILQTIDRIDDQPTSQLRFNARINGCCVCREVFSNCAACSSHCAMSSLKHYITNCTACSPHCVIRPCSFSSRWLCPSTSSCAAVSHLASCLLPVYHKPSNPRHHMGWTDRMGENSFDALGLQALSFRKMPGVGRWHLIAKLTSTPFCQPASRQTLLAAGTQCCTTSNAVGAGGTEQVQHLSC